MELRSVLVDSPTSFGARARSRRRELFASTFPDLASYRVLDLGGTAESWLADGVPRPKALTLVNIHGSELTARQSAAAPEWMRLVVGDACALPELGEEFDLVFSNSLIEHVGGPLRRRMMAEIVRSRAPRYWIQTPYRYFPIEPHWLFPMFQFLPLPAKAWLSSRWPLVHTRSESWDDSVATALDTELIGMTELRHLFPDATIEKERVLGLTKSLIAVRA